jgi:hypothetical protein
MHQVRARAIVDRITNTRWKVECWGEPPHDYVRVYTIDAVSDNMAAREGIDRFVAEMEALEDVG